MRDKDRQILSKIRQYCTEINSVVDGVEFETFVDDFMINRTCTMTLVQIGELAKRLSEDFKSKHNLVPWRRIGDTRNFIVHEYDDIDWETLWQIIRDNVPELLEFTDEILKKIA